MTFNSTPFAVALLAATMLSSAAMAADANTPSAGPYISGQVGYNMPSENALDNNASFAAAAGYRFNPNVRVEGELSYRKNDYSENVDGVSANGDVKGTNLMANAWYDFANSTAFTPYIGGGLGMMRGSAKIGFAGSPTTIDDSDTVFAWQLGAGLAYNVTQNIAVTADYRYIETNNFNFDVKNGLVSTFDAGDYRAHEVRAGLRYSF
jgi:opacity protein-like surface antigen